MSYNPADVYFITESTIDKILVDPVTRTFAIWGGGGPSSPVFANTSLAHGVTTPVVVNGMYSIDGTNFYPMGLPIFGANSAISVGVQQYIIADMYNDATTVYLYVDNGYDAAQTVSYYFTVESLT